jgi:demethylmenaquinone methyltransferase/2-methoxy-6-polyprenyl-1,4-benzoquinol methylase
MSVSSKVEYFNQIAPQWDSLPCPDDAPEKIRRFIGRVLRPEHRAVLDVGCGTGILVGTLLEARPGVKEVLELDLAVEMLRENRRKHADSRIHRVCADAQRLPFRESRFDLVLCFNVLPHLGEIGAALTRLVGVLRPGGTLAIGHAMNSDALNALHASLGGAVGGDQLPPAAALAAELRRIGASVLSEEESPGWYFVEAKRAA